MNFCLTIGVSHAAPLSYLPGAITAAKEIGSWAVNSGFVTRVLTDENDDPITIGRLRKTLEEMLHVNDEIELFVLHFAGHGFRTGAEQNVWLPTDWHKEMRGISVEGLKKQLYRHGIKSLTIFSDACRSLPGDIETAELCADPVLPRGPYNEKPPAIARFNAVMDGREAFMLKGDHVAPARCVFSTVLFEGLSGLRNEAFDQHLPNFVIPDSLASFSSNRLKEIAETYDLKCEPEFLPGFPRDHAVYFRRGTIVENLVAPVWPVPRVGPASGSAPTTGDTYVVDGPRSPVNIDYLDSTGFIRNVPTSDGIPVFPSKEDRSDKNRKIVRRSVARALSLNTAIKQERFNLIVSGEQPRRIWSAVPVSTRGSVENATGYEVDLSGSGSVQLLIELKNGNFTSVVVYRRLVTFLRLEIDGTASWSCYDRFFFLKKQMEGEIDLISAFQLGTLSAERVDDIAAELRTAKHVNPTLGAIASYLYDYTGDVDSIRRMAFFYCYNGQSIPFDVAYMGLIKTRKSLQGPIMAEVPSVAARPDSLNNVARPSWVTKATPRITGDVAGLWPWLRQGWQFMEMPEFEEKNAAAGLTEVVKYLLPSQFSSFKHDGGQILIQKFHLEANS